MRYYEIILNTNAEKIKKNAKVDFMEYRGEDPVYSLNNYAYRNLENGLYFFAYKKADNITHAAFAYDEQRYSFQDAYEAIAGLLREAFRIRIRDGASEITMRQLFEDLSEGSRRQLISSLGRYSDACNTNLYYEWRNNDFRGFGFDLEERIISAGEKRPTIYDKSVTDERANIEENESLAGLNANPVHYVISARGIEAACDIADSVAQSLFRAKRISSSRMTIIKNLHPVMCRKNQYLENLIENNHGGVVVIDMTEHPEHDATRYDRACEFLTRIFRQYRNKCLFIFTYNMDRPGFSYQLLPQIKKYAVTMMLREGRGDRKTAIEYMKTLIRNSDNAKYASQAGKFMKLFPGDDFSQTDVIEMHEKFDSWCLNENVLHAYDYDVSEGFKLDRDVQAVSSYDRLHKMIGLKLVKEQIDRIIASDIIEHERKKRKGTQYKSGAMHMVFSGNPGTAKTTVAELFAGIAREKGILNSGSFVMCGGMDLDGFGCEFKIREAFKAAKGGVLFIDEAYSLTSQIATTILIQELENRRDDVIVVLAGYSERMKRFIEQNEGLKSRVPHWVDFPDYSTDELTEIFSFMLDERGLAVTDDAMKAARYIFEKARSVENFGNGRYVRNLIDRAVMNQSARLLAGRSDASGIRKKDLFLLTKEDISVLDEGEKKERETGTAKKELEELIGLSSAKEIINKAVANYRLNKLCIDRGIKREKAALHMVFTGNPGTAKTTVARLLAEILRDEKVLSTGNFVEAGRADLIGQYIGHTAPLVRRRFRDAQGGVLFIDEAYSLCDDREKGFGDEAISTIVQEMENHRDDVIVIFAGYPEPMKEFLDRNPGMRSRIAFHVEFDDYSTDELCEITQLMARKKGLTVTDAAMAKLKECYAEARKHEGYGNGRFVRKMLEEAEMDLADRIAQLDESELTTELITTVEACDIPEVSFEEQKAFRRRIGFAC